MIRKILLAALILTTPAAAQVSGAGAVSDSVASVPLDLTTAGDVATMPVANGQGVVCADITGLTGSGAIIVAERSAGGAWTPSNMLVGGTGGTLSMSLTQDGTWCSTVVARRGYRVRVSSAGTGAANVNFSLSSNSSLIQMTAPIPPGANVIGSIANAAFGITGALPAGSNALGSVTISNLPATQPISGTVAATQSGAWAFTPSPRTAIASAQVSVGTSATLVAALRATRGSVLIRGNDTTTAIYVGAAGVTTSTGSLVKPGESLTIDGSAAVYAVAASTVTVSVLESF